MRRVVLDTNVVISALFFGGKPAAILDLAIQEVLLLHTSSALVTELDGVLRVKFHLPPHLAEIMVTEWKALNVLVEPTETLSVIMEDPSDNQVLECAVEAKVDVIVSGDRHLLALKTFRGMLILSPNEFLARRHRPV